MKRSALIVAAIMLGGCISNHQVGDNGRPTGQTGGTGGSPTVDGGAGSGGSGGNDGGPNACGPYVAPAPNPTGCPATLPQGSCAGLPTSISCSYISNHCAIEMCSCYHQSTSTDQLWLCMSSGSCGMSSLCPDTPPTELSDCTGLIGESCAYLDHYSFYCGQDSVWRCNSLPAPPLPTQRTPRPDGPPGIDESKQVQQLTMAEAQAWCEWYIGDWGFMPGQAPPDDHGPCQAMPGYVCDYGPAIQPGDSLWYAKGCIERTSISACVANLMLRPCDATVHDLDDCVMTFWDADHHYVGDGCFPYQTHATCNETVVQLNGNVTGIAICAIPIQ